MESDVLCIDRFRFHVRQADATFHALISNATGFQLYWMISLPCAAAEVVTDEGIDRWQPTIYSESMRMPVRDWREIEGQKHHTTSDDDDTACIYIHEHLAMEESEIRFVSRHGNAFGVDWCFS
jgi:hypothetical protein